MRMESSGKAPNADRRREYLKVAAELLVDDLASVTSQWKPGSNNYRAKFAKNPDAIRQIMTQRAKDFRDKAPTSADQAAAVILAGVRAGRWRILVGDDAHILDQRVRADPEHAYDDDFATLWQPGAAASTPQRHD